MSPTAQETRLDRKRREILDAATRAFRDEGYETTSMDRIAELAGASKRTVYNHFESKEALFSAVVTQLFADLSEMAQLTWRPGVAVDEQLMAFARAKCGITEDPAWLGLIRMALGVFIQRPELACSASDRATSCDDATVEWFRAAHEAGALHVPEPERAGWLLASVLKGGLLWPTVLDHTNPYAPTDRETRIRELVTTFLSRYRIAPGAK